MGSYWGLKSWGFFPTPQRPHPTVNFKIFKVVAFGRFPKGCRFALSPHTQRGSRAFQNGRKVTLQLPKGVAPTECGQPARLEPAMETFSDRPCEPSRLLAELTDLSPKPPRSKLEPHRELIRELRRKGRTYRDIARIFGERFHLSVTPSTIHSFVKVRARHRKQVQFELPPATVEASSPVNEQIAALKANHQHRGRSALGSFSAKTNH